MHSRSRARSTAVSVSAKLAAAAAPTTGPKSDGCISLPGFAADQFIRKDMQTCSNLVACLWRSTLLPAQAVQKSSSLTIKHNPRVGRS